MDLTGSIEVCEEIDDECVSAFADAGTDVPCPSPAELRQLAMAQRSRVRVVKVRRDQRLVAFAICCVESARVHGVAVLAYRLFGTSFHDYSFLYSVDVGALGALTDAMRRDARQCGADLVWLENLVSCNEPTTFPRWSTATERTALFAAADEPKSWGGITSRKSFKRHWNKLRSDPRFRVVHTEGQAVLDHVDELARLHHERWHFDGVASAFDEPHRATAYCANPENKVVTRVCLGDEVICMHYGMRYGRTLIWHTPLINVKYLDVSPLEILLTATADYCRNAGLATLDLGLGNEDYKSRIANAARVIHQVVIPVTAAGWLAYLIQASRLSAPLKAAVRAVRGSAVWLRNVLVSLRAEVVWCEVEGLEPIALPAALQAVVITSYASFVDFCRTHSFELSRYQYVRFRGGAQFAALHDGTNVLSSGWLSRAETFEVGEIRRAVSTEGASVLYDFVTPVEHRHRGYYSTLLRALAGSSPNQRLAIFALSSNPSSLKGIRRAGFTERRRYRARPFGW
jgi:CelD/BcsL family acetyltransferase involved in cellulose biosynthesis